MDNFNEIVSSIGLVNAIDIGIIAALIYFVLSWLQGTRAFRILGTLTGIGVFYVATMELGLVLTSILFQYLWAAIIVLLVIVFQPEIREMLDRASPVRYLSGRKTDENPDSLQEIVRACAELAQQRLGALIVLQRTQRLDTILLKGKELDAVVSSEALLMIFQKTSPVHDGAALISGERIKAVSCILPLSKNEELALRYGTRHRAALGLTERSDALCAVVSEESGSVSIVQGTEITTYRRKSEFRRALEQGIRFGRTTPKPLPLSFWASFRENGRLKALSVVAAILLWLVVVGPQRSELGMSIPIQYTNLPPNMEITGTWMDRVDVRLRGSESGLANLRPGSVRAVVKLTNVAPGLNFFRISNKHLLVPPGVTISEIKPSDLSLTIEAASLKRVNVAPGIVGDLPEKTRIIVSPAEVVVRGPQSDLKLVTSVTTEPIAVPDLLQKGKIVAPVVVKPDGLKIEAIEPMLVTVTLEKEGS